MDPMDTRLLAELRRDGRASVTALARRLKQPRSTVQERLRRLLDSGTIRGFRPLLDHAAVGQPSLAYVLASFEPGSGAQHRQIVRDLLRVEGIERVDMVSGEWDIIMRVRGASLEAIGQMIVDRLRTLPTIARTLTLPSFHGVENDL
jgi:Lrp/AsnC family leucine-responsive transcriptional regulator